MSLIELIYKNDLLSESKIDYTITFYLEMKSETPKRPLPRTPHCEELQKFPWFQDILRKEAEMAVSRGIQNNIHTYFHTCLHLPIHILGGIDGTFIVRKSKSGGEDSPFTLTLYYQKKIYNLNIRRLMDGRYALGKRKGNEMVRNFDNLL